MLKSTYNAPPKLPPGWTEHKAPTGHIYYYNAEKRESTYRRPSVLPTQPQPGSNFPAQQPTFPYPTPFTVSTHPTGALQVTRNFDSNVRGVDAQGGRGGGGRQRHDRKHREEDRPRSKVAVPDCEPWLLVKTKLGRRFIYNPDTNESFWRFPKDVLKGVIEYDRIEREKRERRERGERSEEEEIAEEKKKTEADHRPLDEGRSKSPISRGEEQEEGYPDEYEEVEVTDEGEDDEEGPSKKLRTDDEADKPVEFDEDDIAYQLAAMGEDYGLDPGEYGEPGEEGWEEGAEGLPLTEDDSIALFRDLLDDFRINPYTPWDTVIEEGRIIGDNRYTLLPNMKSRRDAWSTWARDRIQEYKERKEKETKKDPRAPYIALLEQYATPKLYWPEFKRKYRKEPEMKNNKLSDKDREKMYREHISRLKLPESTRKSDLLALLKSMPLQNLNNSSKTEALPSAILTDLRYISLSPKSRDEIIEAYISTLPGAPEEAELSVEENEERARKEQDRKKREKALAERERRVQEEKRKQRKAVFHGKDMLRQEDEELQRAMRVDKSGLKGYMDVDEKNSETGQK